MGYVLRRGIERVGNRQLPGAVSSRSLFEAEKRRVDPRESPTAASVEFENISRANPKREKISSVPVFRTAMRAP